MKATAAATVLGLSLVLIAPTAAGSSVTPLSNTPAMRTTPAAVPVPAKKSKKCWNLGKRHFGSTGGLRLRCVKKVAKRKHYHLYRARGIRMAVYKRANTPTGSRLSGYKRHNRKGTKVWIREHRHSGTWVIRWRSESPKQKWIGRLSYSNSEKVWKFYYLKGNKSGRIYEGGVWNR